MRLADLDAFPRASATSRQAIRAFEILFGFALLVEVMCDVDAGGMAVHTGALYPWRWLGLVPLYPPWLVVTVWLVTATGGLGLVLGSSPLQDLAPRLAAIGTFAWVIERFSNHGVLFFLVALYVALDVPARQRASDTRPMLGLVRAQLLIVYVTSALNKLVHGFTSGRSLANLLGWSETLARPASILVVAAELLLPVLLVVRPRAGIFGVVLLHLGFALAMPGLWSFGIAMTAMAVLFAR